MVRKVLLLALLIAAYSPAFSAQTQSEPKPPAEQKKESPAMSGEVYVLSDTMGVDFGPYLKKVMLYINYHWNDLIPDVAKPPVLKAGIVIIQFAIMKNGRVRGLRLSQSSLDTGMDRAAYGAVTDSDPFGPLPQEFRGSYLELRIKFRYNPNKFDSNPRPDKVPPSK